MTTTKEKNELRFCERWLNVKFNGDIENEEEVRAFLNLYLNMAKHNAMT